MEAYSYRIQFWISATKSKTEDFTKISPTSGYLAVTSTTGTREVYNQIIANTSYIKLISFGRFAIK